MICFVNGTEVCFAEPETRKRIRENYDLGGDSNTDKNSESKS